MTYYNKIKKQIMRGRASLQVGGLSTGRGPHIIKRSPVWKILATALLLKISFIVLKKYLFLSQLNNLVSLDVQVFNSVRISMIDQQNYFAAAHEKRITQHDTLMKPGQRERSTCPSLRFLSKVIVFLLLEITYELLSFFLCVIKFLIQVLGNSNYPGIYWDLIT